MSQQVNGTLNPEFPRLWEEFDDETPDEQIMPPRDADEEEDEDDEED